MEVNDMAADKHRTYNIISADGHTIEPPHMWETYLPKQFHAQMPRLVKDPDGGTPGRSFRATRSCRSVW